MKAEPLKSNHYNQAQELGITKIVLEWSGGSDEGHLHVSTQVADRSDEISDEKRKTIHRLESDIEDWAYDVYEYSGAGDGNPYGDTIKYDLVKGTVSTVEWYTKEVYDEPETFTLSVDQT